MIKYDGLDCKMDLLNLGDTCNETDMFLFDI